MRFILEQSIDGGEWYSLGEIESEEEMKVAKEHVAMGSHAICGGQYTCQQRLVPIVEKETNAHCNP